MTLPQDFRSPARNQRWIELENAGGSSIPPFAVVEVTDSYRPEEAGTETPDGGPTVLKVRQATTDNPCSFCINGPQTIPAGERRRLGTMDSPALALFDNTGGSPTVLSEYGIKSGSYYLQQNTDCPLYGFILLGDYDTTTQVGRVQWHLPLSEPVIGVATLDDDMCPTDSTVPISAFTPWNTRCGITISTPSTVSNPHGFVQCRDKEVIVARDGCVWKVISVPPTRLTVTENVEWSAGTCVMTITRSAFYGYTCDPSCGLEGVSSGALLSSCSIYAATGLEAESSVDGSGNVIACGIRLKVTPVCVMACGTETDGDLVSFSNVKPLIDLNWVNPDIVGTFKEHWSLCVQEETTDTLITAVDCETGSS